MRERIARAIFRLGSRIHPGDVFIITPVAAAEASAVFDALDGIFDAGEEPCGPDCLCVIPKEATDD